MRKYLISIILVALIVILGVNQVRSQTEQNQYKKHNINIDQPIQPIKPTNSDILKVSQITGWNIEISEYFVNEANAREVSIFEEALPIVSIETHNTYKFNSINKNINGTHDSGVFQINDATYSSIIKSLKAEGKQFNSWDKLDPKLNISAGMYWISYLKSEHQLEGYKLFTSYNRGVEGAKKYASRCGTYKSDYSKQVEMIRDSY